MPPASTGWHRWQARAWFRLNLDAASERSVHHQQPKEKVTLLLETGPASVKPRLRRQGTGLRASLPRGRPSGSGMRAGYSAEGSSLISGRVMTDSSGGSSRGGANRSLLAASRFSRPNTPPLPAGISLPTITFSFNPAR
jgi:hypothetical protein